MDIFKNSITQMTEKYQNIHLTYRVMHCNSSIFKAIHSVFEFKESFFEQKIHMKLKEEIV